MCVESVVAWILSFAPDEVLRVSCWSTLCASPINCFPREFHFGALGSNCNSKVHFHHFALFCQVVPKTATVHSRPTRRYLLNHDTELICRDLLYLHPRAQLRHLPLSLRTRSILFHFAQFTIVPSDFN